MVQIHAVYYVEGGSYNPLAIEPTFIKPHGATPRCEWGDTDRGSYLYYKAVEPIGLDSQEPREIPREFTLIREEDDIHVKFSFLSLQIFKEKLDGHVAGSPTFATEEELQKFYLHQYFPTM